MEREQSGNLTVAGAPAPQLDEQTARPLPPRPRDRAATGFPVPTAEDRERLRALVDLIDSQPAGTTAGGVEKAAAGAKIVLGTDKYQRYGILIGRAEHGLLPSTLTPNWDRFVVRREVADAWAGGPRSDITPPLSGWRGGIDRERADRMLAL